MSFRGGLLRLQNPLHFAKRQNRIDITHHVSVDHRRFVFPFLNRVQCWPPLSPTGTSSSEYLQSPLLNRLFARFSPSFLTSVVLDRGWLIVSVIPSYCYVQGGYRALAFRT